MSRQAFIESARAYARRNPGDLRQRELLARVEGRTLPPLDVGAARARMAAAAPPRAVQRPAPRPASRPSRPVAIRPAQTLPWFVPRPDAPPGAVQFHSRAAWRWVHIDPAATSGQSWERLASGLTAAGPFQCLRVRSGDLPDSDGGQARFHCDPEDGAMWVDVVVNRAVPAGQSRHVIAHELAHVADETARLERTATASWLRKFADPHCVRRGEEFAVAAEGWVTASTTAAELLAAARAHQAQRRP